METQIPGQDQLIQAARTYLSPKEVNCVLYHSPCVDGFAAAACAWNTLGNQAEYIPMTYQKPIDASQFEGKNILLVDYSFKLSDFIKVQEHAKTILTLDHHESAIHELKGEMGCYFDMDRSGAALSFAYFNLVDHPMPRFIKLIQDRDLWRWEFKAESEPFHAAIWQQVQMSKKSFHYDFRDFCEYYDDEVVAKLIHLGQSILIDNNNRVKQLAVNAQKGMLHIHDGPQKGQYRILFLEAENAELVSELGHYLYDTEECDFVMIWHGIQDNHRYKISLRTENKHIDLAEIAEIYGGGGHPQAAGMKVDGHPKDVLKIQVV